MKNVISIFIMILLYTICVASILETFKENNTKIYYTGEYTLTCYGAQGGSGYQNENIKAEGGKGAKVQGTIHIKGEKEFQFIIGKAGSSSKYGPNPGGSPNGGQGGRDSGVWFGSGDASGGGGGSSTIKMDNKQLIVAGAGAGGVATMKGCPGGKIGQIMCPIKDNNNECASKDEKEGNANGRGGDGDDSSYISGSGGGGGYYGGYASGNYADANPFWAMACSGSSYADDSIL